MKPVQLPPITLGIDMLSNETSLEKGAVRSATNVDLDRNGNFSRRIGYTQKAAGSDYHSLWTAQKRQAMYVANGRTLYQITNLTTLAKTSIYELNSADPLEYSEHNGAIFFSSRSTCGWIPLGLSYLRPLGVAMPNSPNLVASLSGGLQVGDY